MVAGPTSIESALDIVPLKAPPLARYKDTAAPLSTIEPAPLSLFSEPSKPCTSSFAPESIRFARLRKQEAPFRVAALECATRDFGGEIADIGNRRAVGVPDYGAVVRSL